jgi:hypothetical protein
MFLDTFLRTFLIVLVFGTLAQKLSASFSYTLYILTDVIRISLNIHFCIPQTPGYILS